LYISEYRNAPDPEDLPWHSVLLKDHPLPPEAVSEIMEIQKPLDLQFISKD
jgi:hypothetical protein